MEQNQKREIELLFLFWLGFHLQSFINPSTLPFLTLGFLVTGMLLGQLKREDAESLSTKKVNPSPSRKAKYGVAKILSVSIFILGVMPASFFLGTAPLFKDAAFRDAAEMGDGAKLIASTKKWPFNSRLSLETAKVLIENKYDTLALGVLRDLVDNNPLSLDGWRYIYRYSNNPFEKSAALKRILDLDPTNLEFQQINP
jgi:hypothetical protein